MPPDRIRLDGLIVDERHVEAVPREMDFDAPFDTTVADLDRALQANAGAVTLEEMRAPIADVPVVVYDAVHHGSQPVMLDGKVIATSHRYELTISPHVDPKVTERVRQAVAASSQPSDQPAGCACVVDEMADPARNSLAAAQRASVLIDHVERPDSDQGQRLALHRAKSMIESAIWWLGRYRALKEMDARLGSR